MGELRGLLLVLLQCSDYTGQTTNTPQTYHKALLKPTKKLYGFSYPRIAEAIQVWRRHRVNGMMSNDSSMGRENRGYQYKAPLHQYNCSHTGRVVLV